MMANEKRLIDANALRETLCACCSLQQQEECKNDPVCATALVIAEYPTVDAVEVVHGRWEWLGPNRLVSECMCGTCSVCKVRSKYIVNTDICPHCGAKMDGK